MGGDGDGDSDGDSRCECGWEAVNDSGYRSGGQDVAQTDRPGERKRYPDWRRGCERECDSERGSECEWECECEREREWGGHAPIAG